MNWDNVELIRNAQASAKERFKDTQLATNAEIERALQSESAKKIALPRITEVEQMIFKMRSELIDYIVAHGLVDGLIWNGVLQPVESGKIVITKEMVEIMLRNIGYFDEADLRAFLETYLPDNHYVSDAKYVHTDNNFTTTEKQKLAGIEDGAEVNKIIDVIFNGVTVLDDGTRVATINITPEDIKRWYESNPDTNAFTDAEKAKLAGVSDGAEVNRVDDVLVDGRSVLADNKKAKITPEDIKKAYEKNSNTNAFTDAEKADLAAISAWKPEAASDIANNKADIAEAKQNISDIGGEVNTIGGRVTTLETNTTQIRADVDAMSEDAKKHLERKVLLFPLDFAHPSEAGLFDATFKLKLHISYSTGTSTNITFPIHGLVSASGTPIMLAGTLEGSRNSMYIPQLTLTSGTSQGSLLTVSYPSYDKNEEANVTAIECTETPTATYQKIDTGGEASAGGLVKVDSPVNADFAVVTLNKLKYQNMSARLDVMTYSADGWAISTEDVPHTRLIASKIIGKPIILAKSSSEGETENCFSAPSYEYIQNAVYEGNGFFLKCNLPTAKANWFFQVTVGGCTMNRNSKTARLVADDNINVATGDDADTYMTVDFYKVN